MWQFSVQDRASFDQIMAGITTHDLISLYDDIVYDNEYNESPFQYSNPECNYYEPECYE